MIEPEGGAKSIARQFGTVDVDLMLSLNGTSIHDQREFAGDDVRDKGCSVPTNRFFFWIVKRLRARFGPPAVAIGRLMPALMHARVRQVEFRFEFVQAQGIIFFWINFPVTC